MAAHKIVAGRPVLDIGKARRTSITILSEVFKSPPEYNAGGQLTEFVEFLRATAAVEGVRGTDVIRSGQATTQQFWTLTMWHQDGILPNMRVQIERNGSILVIQSVENVLQMDVVLVLNCVGIGGNV